MARSQPRRRASRRLRAAIVAGVAAVFSGSALVHAQRFEPRQPRTVIVGPARGPAPTERLDSARTGFSRVPLPQRGMRVETRRALSAALEVPPLVDAAGNVYAVTVRGEAYVFGRDLTERTRVPTAVPQPGAPTLLSDGTLVYVGAGGDAVGVRAGAIRFRTRVGRPDAGASAPRAAPLSLDDGGVVVAAQNELVVLDAEGTPRARTTLPEAAAAPLVSALDKVIAVGTSGTVFAWAPGGEPARLGAFGSPIDGAAALGDPHTLVAVTADHRQVAAFDLIAGVTIPRAMAPSGTAFLGPPAMRGRTAYAIAMGLTATSAVAIDAAGREVARIPLTLTPPSASVDGGAPQLVVPPHAGALVDSDGTIAFATPDGQVGVVGKGGVDMVPDIVCTRGLGNRSATLVGMAPAGPGALVVACSNGTLVRLAQ